MFYYYEFEKDVKPKLKFKKQKLEVLLKYICHSINLVRSRYKKYMEFLDPGLFKMRKTNRMMYKCKLCIYLEFIEGYRIKIKNV